MTLVMLRIRFTLAIFSVKIKLLARIKHLANSALAHQGFMRYFANTSWMFGEQVLRMLAGVFVGIWVARYLGPEKFGVFSYVIAFVSIFATLARLGLDSIVVRDLVNEPQKRDIYLGTVFWLKLFGAFVTLASLAFVTLFTSNDHTTNLYIFIVASGIIFQSFEVVDFYFQSQVLSKFVSICKITQLLLSSVLKIYFVLTGADLFWFVLVSFIDQVMLAFTLYLAYKYQKLGSFYRFFDWDTAQKLLQDSWPLIFSSLAIAVYMRIDQVMIKEMLGAKEVGLFSAAVRLSEVWYFIPLIITSSITPAIINARNVSYELYKSRLQKLCTVMVWSSIALAVLMTFFSSTLISILYGHAYHAASQALAIQIWGGVFVFIGVSTGVFFTAENYTRKTLYRTTLGAVSNILLNLVMIPKYGIYGAATATLISQFVANFGYDFFDNDVKEIRDIKIKSFFPIFYFKR